MSLQTPSVEKLPLQSWDPLSPPPARYWAFYVRVTCEESVKKDLSIPNQCRRAIEIAMARGWHDYRIFVEPMNVSAELWTDKRPAFKAMLDDVIAGRILGICARHTDRLWRNNMAEADPRIIERGYQSSSALFERVPELKPFVRVARVKKAINKKAKSRNRTTTYQLVRGVYIDKL